MQQYRRGMAFGVFDGLHEGHRNFISQAETKAEKLIIVITRDEIVEQLKKQKPRLSEEARIATIEKEYPLHTVVLGDAKLGSWQVIRTHAPDIILLGYDQQGIAAELTKIGVPHLFLAAHKPEKFKSSLLNKKYSHGEQ